MILGSLAEIVGLRPILFARIAGSKSTLFASPGDLVCGPLQLGLHERLRGADKYRFLRADGLACFVHDDDLHSFGHIAAD
jgi:hypothetical protein